jgi:hypothetical protein
MRSVKESECRYHNLKSLGFVKKGEIKTAEAISVHPKADEKGKDAAAFEIVMPSRTYVIQASDRQEMQTIVSMLQVPVIASGFMSKQGRVNKVESACTGHVDFSIGFIALVIQTSQLGMEEAVFCASGQPEAPLLPR